MRIRKRQTRLNVEEMALVMLLVEAGKSSPMRT